MIESGLRRVEVLRNQQYTVIRMKELKPGDIFRMFNPSKASILDTIDNVTVQWIVRDLPIHLDSSIWEVNVERFK